MTSQSKLVPSMIECLECGAGSPLDAHFCQQCEHILPLPRGSNYFSFFGFMPKLVIDSNSLQDRFRTLSRQLHPDYFYNAQAAERRASLERSSYLNDAYRTLNNLVSRVEYLLKLEGLVSIKSDGESSQVPPALLEEVFALNEELQEIRECREAGGDSSEVKVRLEAARDQIKSKQDSHEKQLFDLSLEWDERQERVILETLRECLLERNYLRNLLTTIDKELEVLGQK